jgi:hypothetical protein
VHVNHVVELANICKRYDSEINDTLLCALSQKYLKLHIQDKETGQVFSYYAIPLPQNIQHYAAVDVLMKHLVIEKLLTLTSNTDFTVYGAPDDLWMGSAVQIWPGTGHHFVIKGTVKFIGAEGRTAESRYWGDKCVGKGRAVVKFDEVLIANVKLSFFFLCKPAIHLTPGIKIIQLDLHLSSMHN